MTRKVQLLIAVLFLGAVIYVYSIPLGSLPPVGNFFHPIKGFWGNAETRELNGSITLNLDGLQEPVEIYFDERRVPHIFAKNDHDLYFAQGYIVARDRLFQMELQAYDAGGRLAEIIGPAMLNRDRNTRRWGMPYGAEKAIEVIKKDEQMWATLNAYSDGVNAYIEGLSPAKYPLEYKILNLAPEEWKPLKTALLLKNMTRTLAAGNSDNQTSNTQKYFGKQFIDKWFTTKPELNDPIIPPTREWNFQADIPLAPDSLFVPTLANALSPFEQAEGVGSNNWAVSGEKTQSGNPILANDPHLELTLPSIWYEVQLHAPGINTYGATLQGAPGVIIGFNENVAWGVTNVSADVMDWYEIQFRDESKQEYRHDGRWKETNFRIEEIKVRGRETVIDTVVYTHHGPVTEVRSSFTEGSEPVYHAQRWIAHDGSNDLKAFYGLNRAENYDDYVEALKHFDAPAQNFVFASNEGDIALWVNGKFPKKWEFQGRTVSDGTDPDYDWQGWIPRDHVPHIKNPERGFVSSANQESAAPDYPYYLDDDFAPFERGRRINDLLDRMENITVEDIQQMQLDTYSYYGEVLLPSLLEWVETDSLNSREMEIYNLMTEWNYDMDAEMIAPSVFRNWRGYFYQSIFLDEYESTPATLRYPARDRFAEVIKNEPDWTFIDDVETDMVETRAYQATNSFKTAISELTDEYGDFGDNWKWGFVIDNDINHMAFIPGMGEQDLFSSGSSEAINATRGTHGPSWRMVVEVGPEVRGYGVYPGGQSGNPGSASYTDFLEPWRTGELFELQFLREKPQLSDKFPLKVTLE
ncbi:MAG: penicillin acylase family protein [Balneolaceae bacterium]|nr:penicillin acylase family protein [Balneolaceae bacterium]MDR9410196.1 penicillin acylase family protein [Balneolaceae bacterium]